MRTVNMNEDNRTETTGWRVLVTGATGTVGAPLVHALATDPRVACVVGFTRSLARVPADLRSQPRLHWRQTNLNALKRGELAAENLTHVVHAAADVRWNQTLAAAREANVEPTAALVRALDGVRGCRLVHVSTAFVEPIDGGHRNTYEQSKAEAEAVVRTSGIDHVIVRPSLVVGDSDTGAVTRPKGLYQLLRLHRAGRLPLLVGHGDALVDMVTTSDCTAAVLHTLGHALCGPALTVAEGVGACTLGEVLDRIASVGWPREVPTIVDPDRWVRFLRPLLRAEVQSRLERFELDVVDAFSPYLRSRRPLIGHACAGAPTPQGFRRCSAVLLAAEAHRSAAPPNLPVSA
jgi:nucleoside-diphosphate-sugar epimerase